MRRQTLVCCCLLALGLLSGPGCAKKVTPPAMPEHVSPAPGPTASPQEIERHQLEQEKSALEEKYGDNLDRIQEINARLIELNIEIRRQSNPHY